MKYIIYTRKSTDSEDKQVQSLESQLKELRSLAQKFNIEVVAEYSESQSAKKLGRPVFAQVIKDIKNGKADGLLVWKLDRLARNMIDGGLIMELVTTGVIKEIRTNSSIFTEKDNVLSMSVVFGMANQYSRDLSENVKRGYRAKLEKGEWPNKAPMGFKNDKNTKQTRVDKKEAPYIRKAFEMYATGNHSIKEIAEVLFEKGFRSKSGKKVSSSNIHLMLKKTFYFGLMESNGKYYKGNHEPLISKKLFDTCQEVRLSYKKTKEQPKKKLSFSMRGLFSCEKCGCMITAEKQKGINYYHCTNGKKICDQKKTYLREDDLEQTLLSQLETLKIDNELINIVHDASLERFHNDVVDTKSNKKRLEAELETLKAKESMLTDKLLEGILSNEVYSSKTKQIQLEIFDLERRISESDLDIEQELATFELTRTAFKAFEIHTSEFSDMDSEKKSQTLKKLLSNSTLKHNNGSKTLTLQYKKPYDVIARADYTELCPELLPD
jgi:site-specific DNA recombinase